MHKKIKPNAASIPHPMYPHCDQRILHAPGECTFCDHNPEWQVLRMAWGIAFTGYEPDANELPDPATHARGLKNLEAWHGNRATKMCE